MTTEQPVTPRPGSGGRAGLAAGLLALAGAVVLVTIFVMRPTSSSQGTGSLTGAGADTAGGASASINGKAPLPIAEAPSAAAPANEGANPNDAQPPATGPTNEPAHSAPSLEKPAAPEGTHPRRSPRAAPKSGASQVQTASPGDAGARPTPSTPVGRDWDTR